MNRGRIASIPGSNTWSYDRTCGLVANLAELAFDGRLVR
jgi:hypothetical protein